MVAAPPPSPPAIVRAWSAALNRNDNAAAARLFAPNAHIIQGPLDARLRCVRALSVVYRELFAARCTPHLSHLDEAGAGVQGEFKPGDRVAYNAGPIGAYAERRLYPVAKAVKLPAGIDDQTAAAMMLRGMTVEYLIRRTFPVSRSLRERGEVRDRTVTRPRRQEVGPNGRSLATVWPMATTPYADDTYC